MSSARTSIHPLVASATDPRVILNQSYHEMKQYANRAKQIKIRAGTAQLLSQEVPWHEVSVDRCAPIPFIRVCLFVCHVLMLPFYVCT